MKQPTRVLANASGVSPPVGMYFHLARVKASEFLFLAGQVARDEGGNAVGKGGAGEQTRQAYENIGRILRSAGASYSNIVQVSTYVVGRASVQPYLDARTELFKEIYPDGDYPPNTLLVIDGLFAEDMLIEITAVAALP